MGLTVTKKLVFEKREVPSGTTLFDFVGVALKDPTSAPVILDALMTELSTQTKYLSLLYENADLDIVMIQAPCPTSSG
jgi:small subunit ribosomal protein S29